VQDLETNLEYLLRPCQRALVDHWPRRQSARMAPFFSGADIGRTSRTQTANRDLIREVLRVGMRRALNQIQRMCRITPKTPASSVPSPLSLTFLLQSTDNSAIRVLRFQFAPRPGFALRLVREISQLPLSLWGTSQFLESPGLSDYDRSHKP